MDTLFLLMKDNSRGKGGEEQVNFTTKTSQVFVGIMEAVLCQGLSLSGEVAEL